MWSPRNGEGGPTERPMLGGISGWAPAFAGEGRWLGEGEARAEMQSGRLAPEAAVWR